jgi:hypothetical protein
MPSNPTSTSLAPHPLAAFVAPPQARTVTRTRDASGREVTQNLLHGVEEARASEFDHQWRSEAERSLPPAWGGAAGAAPRMHAAAHSRRQPALTLPYAGVLCPHALGSRRQCFGNMK